LTGSARSGSESSIRIDLTVAIDRPVEDVFAYLTDASNLPQWQSTLVEMKPETEGPMRVGKRLFETRRFLGRRIESTLEVTEYEPSRRWALRVVQGPVPYRVDHRLEPSNGGTTLSWVGEGEPGRFFKMAKPLVARQAERQFRADFATLKGILESRA
jgi:uncharacterized protein YndB with AHSA1/START domain